MIVPDLIILDGEARTTLGVVRSFVQKGMSVTVGCSNKSVLTSFSRGIKQHFTYCPKGHIEEAHKIIMDYVKFQRPKVLMPVMNWGWSIINNFYKEYEHLTKIVPNPGKELFDKLSNKSCLADLCEQHGISMPETMRPKDLNEALSFRNDLRYPVLLKPQRGESGRGIIRVDEKDELDKALRKFSGIPIIQEFIEGEDLELTILIFNDQPIAGNSYKGLRNYPLPYGPPIACRTIRDDNLMSLGVNFLKKIRYNGIAHLDFRKDRRDGQAKLLDFNPRLAGTNDASIAGGVDFGYMLYKLALGEPINPVFDYKAGKEYRWIFGELEHLIQTPHKLRTLQNLMSINNVSTDFSFFDPGPHLVLLFRKLMQIFSRIKH